MELFPDGLSIYFTYLHVFEEGAEMQRFALSVPSEYDGITRERCQTLVTQ
jgi:hypothetical protein